MNFREARAIRESDSGGRRRPSAAWIPEEFQRDDGKSDSRETARSVWIREARRGEARWNRATWVRGRIPRKSLVHGQKKPGWRKSVERGATRSRAHAESREKETQVLLLQVRDVTRDVIPRQFQADIPRWKRRERRGEILWIFRETRSRRPRRLSTRDARA